MDRQQTIKQKKSQNLKKNEDDCDIFKRIVDNAHDLIYRYEFLPKRCYTYVNPVATEITGYSPEEYYADPDIWNNLIHPDDRQLIQKITNGAQLFDYPMQLRWVCKNGSVIWIEQWTRPLFNNEGNLIAIECMARNITKRKKAEESLRESEERFRALYNNNHAVMLLIDPETGLIMDANQAAVNFYGWSLDELIHMNISEITTSSESEINTVYQQALTTEEQIHVLSDHHRVDGTTRRVEVYIGSIKVGGKVLIYDIVHDITARRVAEDALKQRLLETETAKWVSSALRNAQTEEELIFTLLNEILQTIEIPARAIVLFDKYLGRFRPANKRGWDNELASIDFRKCESLFNDVIETQSEIFFTGDKESSNHECVALPGMPSGWHGVCFPFQTTQTVLGVILISTPNTREISDTDLKLLGIIGDIGATAIQRIRMHVSLEDTLANLQIEMKGRKETEEMLAKEKELLSISLLSIGQGIISTELDKTIALFNTSAELITGFTAAESIGKDIGNIFQILDEGSQKIVSDPIEYLIQYEKMKIENSDSRLPTLLSKKKEKKLISGKLTPILINKKETGFIIVFDDQTENEQIKSQSTLSQKMEAIGQLAAGIAHEINTPIQYVGDNVNFLNRAFLRIKETNDLGMDFIKGHQNKTVKTNEIENLLKEIETRKINHYFDEFPKAFQETLDGIERVRKIVLAIREFSHPSEKEKRLADINNGILTTVTISRNEWKYNADLGTNLEPDLPLVFCQIDEINQVLLNMIINASQSIHERIGQNAAEKGRIDITTKQDDGKVIISIQDTGNGIPAQLLNRIFDPFFTTKGIGRGTGQGLSIAHNIIVNKHHGIIHVDSKIGIGTTFTIELPIEYPAEENRNE